MSTLDEFATPAQKTEARAEKRASWANRKRDFAIQWSVNLEALVDEHGKPCSDNILRKAMKLVTDGLLHEAEPDEEWRVFVTDPIPGSTKTARTIRLNHEGDMVAAGCNCQYASYHKRCAHILAVLMEEGLTHLPLTVIGGVR